MKIASWMPILIGAILCLVIGSVITASLNPRGAAASCKTITRYVTETITVATTYTVPVSQLSSCVIFKALKDYFKVNEPIAFRLINNCDEDLILPNPAPWIVRDSRGEIVFSPVSPQVTTRIKPGSFKEWSWNQKDDQGRNVKPGTYHIEIKTLNRGTFKLSIKIVDQ